MIDFTIAVPIILALVSALKSTGLNPKHAPIVSIFLGVAFFTLLGTDTFKVDIFEGLIAGLSASGLYSGVKTTFK